MFKKGDLVECIDADGATHGLTKGKSYVVSKDQNDVDQVQIAEDDHKETYPWFSSRFQLISGNITIKQVDPTKLSLPVDSTERKEYPLFRGVLKYFPAALAGVAKTSKKGNDKHNPGQELHHARSKSQDHGDCIVRHLVDTADLLAAMERNVGSATQEEILNEVNQLVWRALAFSQELHEKFGAPMAPGAKND